MNLSTVPLKRVASVRVSNVDKNAVDGQEPVRLCNYTDVYYRDTIRSDQEFMVATATREQIAAFRLRPGEVIITKDSETPEDIGVPAYVETSSMDLVCGYHLAIICPSPLIDSRFLFWSMYSAFVRSQFASVATGVTRYGLRTDSMGTVKVPFPSMQCQRAISAFLDSETTRIDALVSKKSQLVNLLEERVDNLIRQRIGDSPLAGLSGNTPAAPIKRLLAKLDRPASTEGGMVTAFRDGQVTARSLRRAEGYTESWTEGTNLQGVHTNDIVVHGLDGFAGAIGVAEADGVCSPVYHVCTPTHDGDPDFIAGMLRILAVSGYLGLFASSTRERAVDFRNWDLFGRIPIPDVNTSEQRQVGELIRKIRPLKKAVVRSAALTIEHKKALVTAAIMGEVDVRGVAA